VAERVRRTWVVGIATCDDVVLLQKQVNTYRNALSDSWDALPADQKGTTGPHGSIALTALGERCSLFEEESCLLGIFAGAQMDRGRALITELDGWRDWLSSAGAPSLPAPVVVPHASASVFETAVDAIPMVLALLAVLFMGSRK
jgi:hypothetical protein